MGRMDESESEKMVYRRIGKALTNYDSKQKFKQQLGGLERYYSQNSSNNYFNKGNSERTKTFFKRFKRLF